MVYVQSNLAAVRDLVEIQNAKNPKQQLALACHDHPINHVVMGDPEAVKAFEKLTNQ